VPTPSVFKNINDEKKIDIPKQTKSIPREKIIVESLSDEDRQLLINNIKSRKMFSLTQNLMMILLTFVLIYLIYVYYIKISLNGVWVNKNDDNNKTINISHNPFNDDVKLIMYNVGEEPKSILCKYKNKKLLMDNGQYAMHDIYENVLSWNDGNLYARI
jgi:hypothetical protein